ncbi:unnamed protein product [Lactuca saligna]|uniref:Uncharacterized protein n=1 Tax=Lactuca saligna TaxID=75948 RepID=A0AA35XY60_LACSI|nr:unnamed protein product [Lactuca saligna]
MEVRLRQMPHRAGNIFKIQYSIGWSDPDPALERNYFNQTRVTHDFMTTFVSKNPSGAFLNYRDLDIGVMTGDSYSEGKVYGQYHRLNFDCCPEVHSEFIPLISFGNASILLLFISIVLPKDFIEYE